MLQSDTNGDEDLMSKLAQTNQGPGCQLHQEPGCLLDKEPGCLLQLEVITLNSRSATVKWTGTDHLTNACVDCVEISVNKITEHDTVDNDPPPVTYSAPYKAGHLDLPDIEGGRTYSVTVKAVKTVQYENRSCKYVISQQDVTFQSVLSVEELKSLLKMAEEYTSGKDSYQDIIHLYRNKPLEYWVDIYKTHGAIMEPYLTDYNGNSGCPINGKIKGLFLSGRRDTKTGELPQESPYGKIRFVMPVDRLYNECQNMYFADFYCDNKVHYVTVVLARGGSDSDQFCAKHCVKLDPCNNPFFMCVDPGDGIPRYQMSVKVHVEVLYTEDIDVYYERQMYEDFPEMYSGCGWKEVRSTFSGSPTAKRIRKKSLCNVCSIYRTKRKREVEGDDCDNNKKQKASSDQETLTISVNNNIGEKVECSIDDNINSLLSSETGVASQDCIQVDSLVVNNTGVSTLGCVKVESLMSINTGVIDQDCDKQNTPAEIMSINAGATLDCEKVDSLVHNNTGVTTRDCKVDSLMNIKTGVAIKDCVKVESLMSINTGVATQDCIKIDSLMSIDTGAATKDCDKQNTPEIPSLLNLNIAPPSLFSINPGVIIPIQQQVCVVDKELPSKCIKKKKPVKKQPACLTVRNLMDVDTSMAPVRRLSAESAGNENEGDKDSSTAVPNDAKDDKEGVCCNHKETPIVVPNSGNNDKEGNCCDRNSDSITDKMDVRGDLKLPCEDIIAEIAVPNSPILSDKGDVNHAAGVIDLATEDSVAPTCHTSVNLQPPVSAEPTSVHMHPPVSAEPTSVHMHPPVSAEPTSVHMHPPVSAEHTSVHLHSPVSAEHTSVHMHPPVSAEHTSVHMHPPVSAEHTSVHMHPPVSAEHTSVHMYPPVSAKQTSVQLHSPVYPEPTKVHLHSPVYPEPTKVHLHSPVYPEPTKVHLHSPVYPEPIKVHLHSPVYPEPTKVHLHSPVFPEPTKVHLHSPVYPEPTKVHLHSPVYPEPTKVCLHSPVYPEPTKVHLHSPVYPKPTKVHLHSPVYPETTKVHLHSPVYPEPTKVHLHSPVYPEPPKVHLHSPVYPEPTKVHLHSPVYSEPPKVHLHSPVSPKHTSVHKHSPVSSKPTPVHMHPPVSPDPNSVHTHSPVSADLFERLLYMKQVCVASIAVNQAQNRIISLLQTGSSLCNTQASELNDVSIQSPPNLSDNRDSDNCSVTLETRSPPDTLDEVGSKAESLCPGGKSKDKSIDSVINANTVVDKEMEPELKHFAEKAAELEPEYSVYSDISSDSDIDLEEGELPPSPHAPLPVSESDPDQTLLESCLQKQIFSIRVRKKIPSRYKSRRKSSGKDSIQNHEDREKSLSKRRDKKRHHSRERQRSKKP